MKHLTSFLLAVSLAILLASCSSTRKVLNEQTQQQNTSAVTAEQRTQQNTSEAVEVRRTETDLSNVVIDFTKIEYADGTIATTTTTDTTEQRGTSQMRDREATEPPNVDKNVKSVTSGRVIINNDKKTQTETSATSDNSTQIETAVTSDLTENTTSQTKTEDKEKHGFFYYFGIVICGILLFVTILVVCYFVIRLKLRKNNQ